MTIVLLLLAGLLQVTNRLPPPEAWVAAERAIVRLPPAAFTTLPAAIRRDLERRRCTIPQSDLEGEPHNVIRGRFTTAKQFDIAVLCSVDSSSTILVYRGEDIKTVAQLANSKDADWLQTGGPKSIVFSRAILPASAKDIAVYYKEFGGTKPPPVDHDGIHDAFVGKASVIRYWHRGAWLELTGMD